MSGLLAVGCGPSDGTDGGSAGSGPKMGAATPNCGTVQEPLAIALKDVSPALDASVPNAAIVQRFTIVGRHLQIEPGFALPASHTAGQSVPAVVHWTYAASGNDTVYTSEPFTWQNAPAQVEVVSSGLLVTSDGCVSNLPPTMFRYSLTAP